MRLSSANRWTSFYDKSTQFVFCGVRLVDFLLYQMLCIRLLCVYQLQCVCSVTICAQLSKKQLCVLVFVQRLQIEL